MKKHIKRMLSFGVILSILFGTLTTSFASTDVQVTVINNPKIDIMLTSKVTNYDLSKFEQDVRTTLQNKGINTNNIEFQTVKREIVETSSNDVNFAQAVNNWKAIGETAWHANNNGQIYLDLTAGSTAISTQWTAAQNYSSCNPGWYGEALVNDKENNLENMKIDFTLAQGGTLLGGICFNTTIEDDNSLSGYFFTISTHAGGLRLWKMSHYAIDDYFSHGANLAIWCNPDQNRINWTDTDWKDVANDPWIVGNTTVVQNAGINDNITSTITCLAAWDKPSGANIKYSVKTDSETGHIIITQNGNTVVDLYDKTYTSGTYGVWGNNCEQKHSMYISDFKVSADKNTFKTFKNVLTEPTWREDAKHVIVNVDNTIDDTLTSSATIGEILSRTLADDIHFIQWGTDANKAATTNFIKQNDNKGTFTYNADYNKAVEDTATYIKGLIEQEASEQFITIGQNIDLIVTPENFKTGATSTDYPNGRWKINHDYKYFANNLGQSADAGIYTPNLNCGFDKPGKYEILFDDELVKTVYVHRKPVADFEIEFTSTGIALLSTSYDLDSNIDKNFGPGIAEENWYYKKVSESTWTNGKLSEINKNDIYVIKLEVTDNQGVTSYTTKYVGTGNPVANFNFANSTICKFHKLEINNTSYDPVGYNITTQSWELKKDGVLIGTYLEPIVDFNTSNLGPGNYSYTLVVTNEQNTKSEAYTKSFTVVDDVAKPEITIDTEITNAWLPSKDVDIEVSDNESNVAKWRYEFVTSPTPTVSNEEWSNWETEQTEMTINSGALSGRYYLHIQAYDSANNLTERTIGPFNLDNTNPVINGVDVNKLGFRETKVTVDAFDEHSGVVGYALTKYETATFNLRARTFAAVETPEFQESNEFMVDEDGLYTAWAIDALGNVETSICEVTQSNQTDKTTNVYAEIGSEFKVTIPKRIVLDGSTKSGTYQVTVEGDIAGLETITVEPENAVTLSSKNKADVVGSIAQDKTNWTYSEIYTDSKILANGAISAQDLTAGAWNGTFNFNIKLENNGKYTNSEWNVEYQEFIFGGENTDNSDTTNSTE